MVNFYDFNQEIRNLLETMYNHKVGLYENLEQIKLENYSLYQNILGLIFLDSYRILKDKEKYDNLTVKEIELVSILNEIEDIDDLLIFINENPSYLSSFIIGTVKFNKLNIKGKATLLLTTSDEYALKFNKFYLFEKYNMFRERTVEEILHNSNNKKDQNKVDDLINLLDVLFIGNIHSFSKLMLEILQVFYKWKKILQLKKPELTFGIDDSIIEIVEINPQDKILYTLSCDPNLIEIIVTDFFEYNSFDEEIKNEIEEAYNKLISNDIKIKLKEV